MTETQQSIIPWTIECVSRRTVSTARWYPRPLPKGVWQELARELSLRLERTPTRDALRVEFASVMLARRAFAGLRHYLRADQVEIHKHDNVLF